MLFDFFPYAKRYPLGQSLNGINLKTQCAGLRPLRPSDFAHSASRSPLGRAGGFRPGGAAAQLREAKGF